MGEVSGGIHEPQPDASPPISLVGNAYPDVLVELRYRAIRGFLPEVVGFPGAAIQAYLVGGQSATADLLPVIDGGILGSQMQG